MKFKLLLICIGSVLLLQNPVHSQGLKMEVFGYTSLHTSYTSTFYYGFGYEQNVGDKISLALSYRKGYSADPDYSSVTERYSFIGNENGVNYDVSFELASISSWHEWNYSSKYFFDDNMSGSYFSTSIGYLKSAVEYDVKNLSVDYAQVYSAFDVRIGYFNQDITLIPVSFDFGTRSEFDGWYYDLYLGVSTLPFGSKKEIKPQFLHNRGVESLFVPVSFHIAFSIGVSWAD